MKSAWNLLVLGFVASFAVACGGDSSDSKPDPDNDSGQRASADAGMGDDAARNAGFDAGNADAGLADSGHDGGDTGPDAAGADAGGADRLPFRGDVTFNDDFIPKALVPFEIEDEGVLVIELFDGPIDLGAVRVELCGPQPNDCVGLSVRPPPRDYMPHRSLSDVEPGSYSVEFSSSRIDEDDVDRTFDVGIEFLPFQSITEPPTSPDAARTLEFRGAYEVSVRENVPAWFAVDTTGPGYLSILRTNDRVFVCDMATWAVNLPGCLFGTRETARDIDRAGPVYVLATSTHDTTHGFVVFFDADPNATICPAGEHPAGDGTCAPLGTCAAGHHDGGWGECLPDGTCSPRFELRPDGRCEGWVSAGTLDSFDAVNDEVIAGPDGAIIVSGEQDDANGDRVYAPQVWNPTTQSWSVADPAVSPLGARRICPLADGRILTMRYGGFISTAPTDSEQIFDPLTGTWAPPQTTSGESWSRPTCLLLEDGTTLVFEGGDAFVFDPTLETWTTAGTGPIGTDHKAVEVSPGVVYSAFQNPARTPTRYLSRWHAADDSWTASPDWLLSEALDNGSGHLVAVGGDPLLFLNDGRVVRFDTATNTWESLASIESPPFTVFVQRAKAVGDEVFFTYRGQTSQAGVYDVATQQWRELPEPVQSGAPMISRGEYLLVGKYPQRLVVGD